MRPVVTRSADNVDRLLRKERLLYDSRYFYSKRLWVICDEHFEQQLSSRTKQPVAVAVKQVFDVTLEAYKQLIHKASQVYRWLGYYDNLWVDGVATLTRKQLDGFLYYLEDAEKTASKVEQGGAGVGPTLSQPSEGETREEDRYALRDAEVF